MPIARTPREQDELVQQAEGLFAGGDLDAALHLLSQVVEANPCHVRALNDLGTVCYSRGAAAYAVRFFRRALETEPSNLLSRTNLITLLLELGQLDAARELLAAGAGHHPGEAALEALRLELQKLEVRAHFALSVAAASEQLEREAARRVSAALPTEPAAPMQPVDPASRDVMFRQAFNTFQQNPAACAQSGHPVLRDLIRGWGNEIWSAADEYLAACVQQALVTEGPILECGSGLSTLLVGTVAAKRGLPHWALEHMPEWAAHVQLRLRQCALRSVRVIAAPLKNYGEFSWYDAPLAAMPASFSMVICDGPPAITPGGRYGLVPVMKSRLGPGCTLLLDDAHRQQERTIACHWKVELGAALTLCGAGRAYIRLTLPPTTQSSAASAHAAA